MEFFYFSSPGILWKSQIVLGIISLMTLVAKGVKSRLTTLVAKGDEDTNATERSRKSGRRNKNHRNKNSETTVPQKSWLNQLVKAVTNCLGIA